MCAAPKCWSKYTTHTNSFVQTGNKKDRRRKSVSKEEWEKKRGNTIIQKNVENHRIIGDLLAPELQSDRQKEREKDKTRLRESVNKGVRGRAEIRLSKK